MYNVHVHVLCTHSGDVFDDSSWEVLLQFDDHLNQLVEVVGTHLEHLQHPGEHPAIKAITIITDWVNPTCLFVCNENTVKGYYFCISALVGRFC